jgi:hypothetical protein
MIERYAVVAGLIRQELAEVEGIVSRAERAVRVARQRPEDQDLLLDSAALNLHDFYAGLERIFYHIFEFDPDQIENLVKRLRPSFELVKAELLAFAEFLDQLVQAG